MLPAVLEQLLQLSQVWICDKIKFEFNKNIHETQTRNKDNHKLKKI